MSALSLDETSSWLPSKEQLAKEKEGKKEKNILKPLLNLPLNVCNNEHLIILMEGYLVPRATIRSSRLVCD